MSFRQAWWLITRWVECYKYVHLKDWRILNICQTGLAPNYDDIPTVEPLVLLNVYTYIVAESDCYPTFDVIPILQLHYKSMNMLYSNQLTEVCSSAQSYLLNAISFRFISQSSAIKKGKYLPNLAFIAILDCRHTESVWFRYCNESIPHHVTFAQQEIISKVRKTISESNLLSPSNKRTKFLARSFWWNSLTLTYLLCIVTLHLFNYNSIYFAKLPK